MTIPTPDPGRPVPDLVDLRLLAEIINNGAIGLPQAAWNAGMSQSEAAARLVTLAERGMPLRLVAEGDRQQLWYIAQAGPAPVPVPSAADLAPVWGAPRSSERVGAADTGEYAEPGASLEPAVSREPALSSPSVEPTRRTLTSGQPVQAVVGLFGEQLDVGLQQILDPADSILTAVGHRMDDGQRALLVEISVGNRGPVAYEALADQYLDVVDTEGAVLPQAAISVAGYPGHRVGVPANTLVSGWTVFLVPAGTQVAQVRWSVRPDLLDRTAVWTFGPAPAADASPAPD